MAGIRRAWTARPPAGKMSGPYYYFDYRWYRLSRYVTSPVGRLTLGGHRVCVRCPVCQSCRCIVIPHTAHTPHSGADHMPEPLSRPAGPTGAPPSSIAHQLELMDAPALGIREEDGALVAAHMDAVQAAEARRHDDLLRDTVGQQDLHAPLLGN